jgi:hypothetical protein
MDLTQDETEGFWWLALRFSSAGKPFISMIITTGARVEMSEAKVLPDSVKSIYDVGRNGFTVEYDCREGPFT